VSTNAFSVAGRVLGARPGVEASDHEADAVDQAFA
jgi:hypothetical protein